MLALGTKTWRVEVRPIDAIRKDQQLFNRLNKLTNASQSDFAMSLRRAKEITCYWVMFLFYLDDTIVGWGLLKGGQFGVFVQKEHRRKGIARKIAEEIYVHRNLYCPVRPSKLVGFEWNRSSRAFFKSLDFVRCS